MPRSAAACLLPRSTQPSQLLGKVRDMRKLLIIGSLVAPLALGPAFAQAPPAAKDAPKAAAKSTSKERSAASIECSKRADEKKLHGQERRKFRASCKKELEKKG